MNAITKLAAATIITVSAATSAWAQDAHAAHQAHDAHAAHKAKDAHAAHGAHGKHDAGAAAAMVEGEIRKIDKDAGKLTIRHGEIKNLGMAPMTMVFRVKDAAMLGQVKVGDKVNFAAEKVNGMITVVKLDAAK